MTEGERSEARAERDKVSRRWSGNEALERRDTTFAVVVVRDERAIVNVVSQVESPSPGPMLQRHHGCTRVSNPNDVDPPERL